MNFGGLASVGLRLTAIGVATGLATLAGGSLALRLRSGVEKLMGFGSGVVISVALMDLLPEALDLGGRVWRPLILTGIMVAGFMTYAMVGRLTGQLGKVSGPVGRHLGPASLVLHSLMDGLGIGVAFNVSTAAGLILAIAVLAHDLLDGANTVTLSLAGGLSPRVSRRWLAMDAAAPLIGLALSRAIQPSAAVLSVLLAFFAGLFLFIGATELLPRSRSQTADLSGAVSMVVGAAFMFAVVWIGSR